MSAVARAALALSALTGLALAWVLFDWIGNYSAHCDFDSTCLTTWLPKAFMTTQYLWLAVVLTGAVGIAAAIVSGWRRREVLLLSVTWVVIVLSVGATPMHGGGDPIHMGLLLGDPFFYGSFPWYRLLGIVVAAASLVFGIEALRSPADETTELGASSTLA
jgi:hypothetical protein